MEERELVLEGVDGDRIQLHGGRRGPVRLLEFNAEDLYMPPEEILTSSGAFQVGSTPRKTVEDQRKFPLVLGTHGTSIRAHDRIESALWRMFPTRGDFRVAKLRSKSGSDRRWLDVLRSGVKSSTVTGLAPEAFGNNFLEHTVTLLACNPAWQGGTRVDETAGSGLMQLKISNPTDRHQWLKFAGSGGVSWAIQDGLSDRMVPIPPTAQRWKVYTDPQEPTFEVEDGPSGWPQNMGGVTFTQPIPPGTPPTMIDVACSGAGEILVEMVDQYCRPWG